MSRGIRISRVRFCPAAENDLAGGLVGWIACTLNDALRLEGLALRRTKAARLALSFPERRDRHGSQRFPLRPIDDRARRDIEHQIFRALGMEAMP